MNITIYVSRETKALEEIKAFNFIGMSPLESSTALRKLLVNNSTLDFTVKDNQPTTVNYLGHLISESKINHKQVKVIYYINNTWQSTKFDAEGFLIDWPFGYFNF